MPPRKEQPPRESPRVVIRRVKRKPASSPVIVEKKRAKPPRAKPEPPRQSAPQPSPKPVVVEKGKVVPPAPAAAPQPEQGSQSAVSPEEEAARAAARKRDNAEVWELLQQIMDRWPQTYPRAARAVRPLMSPQVMKQLRQEFPAQRPVLIRHAVGLWHKRYGVAYLKATIAGGARYDLEGEAVGEVTPEEQARSCQLLRAITTRRRAKQQAREHRPPASPPSVEQENPETEGSDS